MPQLSLGRLSRWILPLGLMLASGAAAGQAASGPERVVSLNLCTDQLLLALADRGQIAALSHLARDRSIAFLAEQAKGLPVSRGGAEGILLDAPDLVLAGTYGQQKLVSFLKGRGVEILTLGPWASLEEGREQIRTAARRLGHPERGEALIARIDAALEHVKGIVPAGRSVLIYDRGGWATSVNSPLSEILIHMGFTLHQKALELPYGGLVRLETLVTSPPDYMLVDDSVLHPIDNSTALFAHPALLEAVPMERRLVVPGRLSVCDGPSTPDAIGALAAEVAAKVR